MSKTVTRLYAQFQPEKYELEIRLDEEKMRFSGRVVISGKKVGRPSQRLTFHANGVKVTSGKVVRRDKKVMLSYRSSASIIRRRSKKSGFIPKA
ncbi:hypothetical protein IPL68_07710 [Candidatus Saccharibacteria bacterium]|nr:MAG: hypothetical protein IPL68_07710 [Candidatus Saccharibacteria bacterium]